VGKSALLSWFVLHPPPHVQVISFFITARFASQDDRVAFADAVLEQALALLGQPVPALLTESTRDAHMLARLSDAAAVCRERGERLVLVVDGLDEDSGTDSHSIAALLPVRPAAGMRVIVASRPNPPLPVDLREDHPLRDLTAARVLAQSPYAARTRATMQREVKRLLAEKSDDRDLLGLVVAAGGGLTARDLAELTARRSWQVEDRLRAAAGRTFLTQVGLWQNEEAYVLGHEELHNEAVSLLGEEALDGYRQRLHDWAEGYAKRGWPDSSPDFLMQGYFHLVRATEPLARTVRLVTDPARQVRMLARSGAESAAAAELTMTQDAILMQERPDLAAMAAVALHRDVLVRRNRNISSDLPALWARLGEPARAEALAQSISDPSQRAAALQSIAAVASLSGLDDREQAPPPLPSISPTPNDVAASATSDDPARHDVETLIVAARSNDAADAAALLETAEATACTARDPDLRTSLRNDVARAREAAASRDASARPGTSLDASRRPWYTTLDDVVRRAVAMGDLDRAMCIARIVYRAAPTSGLLSAIVEHAAKEDGIARAEQIALSFPAGTGQTKALLELVYVAAETGALSSAEGIAQTLLAITGSPEAFLLVAMAAQARGDAGRSEELLAEALQARPDLLSWMAEHAILDLLRSLADVGGVEAAERLIAAVGGTEEAVSDALARVSGKIRLRELLAMAQRLSYQGSDKLAKVLATQVLREVGTASPDLWLSIRDCDAILGDTAGLLMKLGEVEQARTAVFEMANPETQPDVLIQIVEAELEAGDLAAAEATSDLIVDPTTRDELLPSFVRAHVRVGDHAAAMAAAQRLLDPGLPTELVTKVVRHALDEGALDFAATVVQAIREHDVQVALSLEVARTAVASNEPEQARVFLNAAETAARSVPDPAWRAEALTEAAWALLPAVDIDRVGMLTASAEAAARGIPDTELRAAVLVDIAAVVMAAGDTDRANVTFREAANVSPIPCACAERLAARARATADRGHHHTAQAQVSAVGSLARWITEPNNRARAAQARLAAAIHIGDLRQAEEAAYAIEHPDQQALALVDVARALAAAGQAKRAIEIALAITNGDRQADALAEVARLAAALGELVLAERAARAITAYGGQSPAMLSVAWEAARVGDLTRAEQIVVSIADHEWRQLGLHAIHAQRGVPTAVPTQPDSLPVTQCGPKVTSAATDVEPQARNLLSRVDAMPDQPSAARLLAEAMRAGPCVPVLASLGRVNPAAALTAADTLLALLR
jgi:tetratricopeptide (TPR) repeat protein